MIDVCLCVEQGVGHLSTIVYYFALWYTMNIV